MKVVELFPMRVYRFTLNKFIEEIKSFYALMELFHFRYGGIFIY